MVDDNILEPDEDKMSPLAEQVKAFLQQEEEEKKKEEEKGAAEANTLLTPDKPKEDNTLEEIAKLKRQEGLDEERIELGADTTFEENIMAKEPVFNIQVLMQSIPITQEDERMYLKSMLNDTPLTLLISLYGGKLELLCRACSVYEQQLAAVAAYRETAKADSMGVASIIAPSLIQKLRIALQIRSCNGIIVSDLSYSPEPNSFITHADDLLARSEKLVGGTNAARWNAYVYALNIFEHKLAKLNEMALNKDFLSPGD